MKNLMFNLFLDLFSWKVNGCKCIYFYYVNILFEDLYP